MTDAPKCQACFKPSPNAFLCHQCERELHTKLSQFPWLIARLTESAVGQARLGEPARRSHRAGLERYANPKPAVDGNGPEGQRILAQDLHDDRLRNRLLAEGGVNARASDLLDDVRNMLTGWCRDVCERRGLYWIADPKFIGPLLANEMRFAPNTAESMAVWLREHVSALAAAECAGETFADVKRAEEGMLRAVNRPPPLKTCGPCPTLGRHSKDASGKKTFTVDSEMRTRCGTQLEARQSATNVQCPSCRQEHEVDDLIEQLNRDLDGMSFTIGQLANLVLPRNDEHVPRRTLYDWANKELMKPTGRDEVGKARYLLADVRKLRAEWWTPKKARMSA